jgi:hypothetical protein
MHIQPLYAWALFDEGGGVLKVGGAGLEHVGGDWRGGGVEYNNMYITLEPPSLSTSRLV